MFFSNDLVLVDESRDSVNAELERWWEALEFKGFKISCTKIEYMYRRFSGDVQGVETTMRIEAQEIPQRDSYQCLNLIICNDVEIEKDVKHRIRARRLM